MKEIKIKSAGETIYSFNAPTGLPVYMWVSKEKTNVYLTLNVKYGSNGTEFKCNNVLYNVPTGTAHYLEHLKFHLKDQDASNLFYDLGCDSNAYTSYNETSYEVYANDNIYESAKLLLNFVYDNYFTKTLVNNERGIILEEANSGKDDPEYNFFQKSLQNYFTKSTYRNPVIGYESDIKKISIDDISLVHDYFYRPENMFMVITGNFDPVEMEKVICENESERTFKDIGKVEIVKHKETEEMKEKEFFVEPKNCINIQGKYMIKTKESAFKEYTKSEVLIGLRTIIQANFGVSSDFYEELIQEEKATSLGVNVSYDDGVYGIVFSFVSDNPDVVVELIKNKLDKVNITKEELVRFRKSTESTNIMRYDNIYSVASYLISNMIDNNNILDDKIDILNKITLKEIKDIYSKVNLKNTSVGVLRPKLD